MVWLTRATVDRQSVEDAPEPHDLLLLEAHLLDRDLLLLQKRRRHLAQTNAHEVEKLLEIEVLCFGRVGGLYNCLLRPLPLILVRLGAFEQLLQQLADLFRAPNFTCQPLCKTEEDLSEGLELVVKETEVLADRVANPTSMLAERTKHTPAILGELALGEVSLEVGEHCRRSLVAQCMEDPVQPRLKLTVGYCRLLPQHAPAATRVTFLRGALGAEERTRGRWLCLCLFQDLHDALHFAFAHDGHDPDKLLLPKLCAGKLHTVQQLLNLPKLRRVTQPAQGAKELHHRDVQIEGFGLRDRGA
mmetsp:Transcript_45797/g.108836  ORF Transcript_45797/g.108836 Transcript_45797/m.108836 type:complete len:302 (-) Transcript_45797:1257-2162(-)